jgi:hypothetical protein
MKRKSCLGIIVFLFIVAIGTMFAFKICPPPGPWPLPPWCENFGNSFATPFLKSDSNEDQYECFPENCNSLNDNDLELKCNDWKNGIDIWPIDCSKETSESCISLCEKENAEIPGKRMFLHSEVDIYGRDFYFDLVDWPLTGTVYPFGPGLVTEYTATEFLKDRGADVLNVVSIWNEDTWKKKEDLPDELKNAYVSGIDDEIMTIQEVVFLNLLDPSYQDWIKDKMVELIDLGTDGFTFDEHWGTTAAAMWAEEDVGPCDEFALMGFQDYLRGKYTSSELAQLSIKDISSFNYCEYIEENSLTEQFREDVYKIPLGTDFLEYLMRANSEVIKDIIDFVIMYANENGKEIALGANLDNLEKWDELTYYDNLDLYISEHQWWPEWRNESPYVNISAGWPVSPKMKYAHNLGKRKVAMYHIHDAKGFRQRDISGGSILITHEIAEAYANRGFYMYFDLNDYLGLDFQADREYLYPYFNFLRDYPDAFLDLEQKNEIAVVIPPHTNFLNRASISTQSISVALSMQNISHDVTDLNRIGDYSVVILSGYAWSDSNINTMLDYLENGGIIIAYDQRFASLNENFEEVSRPDLRGFKTRGKHIYGDGSFIFFDQDIGWEIWAYLNPEAIQTIVDVLFDYADTIVAPQNIQVLPYIKDTSLVIHILNYDFQAKDFVKKENFLIEVEIPEGISVENRTIKLVSPDFKEELIASYEQNGNILSISVPQLYIWDVLIME